MVSSLTIKYVVCSESKPVKLEARRTVILAPLRCVFSGGGLHAETCSEYP